MTHKKDLLNITNFEFWFNNGLPCTTICYIAKTPSYGYSTTINVIIRNNETFRFMFCPLIYKNENKILILASDQDAKHKGVIVDFFGKKTSVPKGAALFHLKTKAALIFSVGTLDDDGNMSISFELVEANKKSSVESITQAYTKMLELKISEFPDHYFWFHKKWKSDYK